MVSLSEGWPPAWRIARDTYPLLDGSGAAEFGGRWNSPGRRVIYCGGSFAIAVLERLVYLPSGRIPHNQVYTRLTFPQGLKIEMIDGSDVPGWDADDQTASRAYGDAWHDEGRTAVLVVPSAVTKLDVNVLISQEHPAFAGIRADAPRPVSWDARLFRR